jgi:RNA polymerase sigma-70 factor (ECF subfamily)
VGAELRLFEGELRALLDHAVDALPPDYRAVFVLREVEEMDTAETADALGVSQEVVRARLMRARATLRKDLYRRAGVTTADVFHLHLTRCDRVVQAVIPRIVPVA